MKGNPLRKQQPSKPLTASWWQAQALGSVVRGLSARISCDSAETQLRRSVLRPLVGPWSGGVGGGEQWTRGAAAAFLRPCVKTVTTPARREADGSGGLRPGRAGRGCSGGSDWQRAVHSLSALPLRPDRPCSQSPRHQNTRFRASKHPLPSIAAPPGPAVRAAPVVQRWGPAIPGPRGPSGFYTGDHGVRPRRTGEAGVVAEVAVSREAGLGGAGGLADI